MAINIDNYAQSRYDDYLKCRSKVQVAYPGSSNVKKCPWCKIGSLTKEEGGYLCCNMIACSYKQPMSQPTPQQHIGAPIQIEFTDPQDTGSRQEQRPQLICQQFESTGPRRHIEELRGKRKGRHDPDIILGSGAYVVTSAEYNYTEHGWDRIA